MQFSEHEMTVAVDAAARQLFLGSRAPWRRRRARQAWEQLPAFQKYQHRAAAGEIVLPTLTALPERPAPGGRPRFSLGELLEAGAAGAQSLTDHRSPGAWERLPERKRRRIARLAAVTTQLALAAMPPRPEAPPAGGLQPSDN